jgi:AcrR family transcriptional regulator
VAESGRQRLLDAAVVGLVALDPAALTVDAICGGASVSAPTLYHHFGSKDGLLAAAVDELVTQWLALLDAVVPRVAQLESALPIALERWEEMILSPQRPLAVFAWSVLLVAPASAEVRTALQRARNQGESMIADRLRDFLEIESQAEPMAQMAVNILVGTAVQYELDHDASGVRDRLKLLRDLLLAMANGKVPSAVRPG